MKKPVFILISVVALVLAFGVLLTSQEGSSELPTESLAPDWRSFDEGIVLAGEENKKLLIDVYTDWCGWCKRMDSEVYSNTAVIAALDASFISIKLNAESSRELVYLGSRLTETQFASSAGVTGYPTTLFFHPDGRPLTRVPGFVSAEKFVSILNYIGQNHFQAISFEEYLARSSSSR
ncbi:MAG: DUF255 domain-containing protein [Ignavibacteriales bacterium]|nr:DUF255 domain-containing protein [Ignavibacteriales bacterium]